ncbi:hypothetical protein E2C01_023886 [Portunus trituberculatus]|uniref:Uncharacterized protein n=1 Tax=Portunus trituberculatus TaxID=210409 RepID=A0A5B7EB96_PORTR|nr:hypothetical protein [Portunus trituberculatus]
MGRGGVGGCGRVISDVSPSRFSYSSTEEQPHYFATRTPEYTSDDTVQPLHHPTIPHLIGRSVRGGGDARLKLCGRQNVGTWKRCP